MIDFEYGKKNYFKTTDGEFISVELDRYPESPRSMYDCAGTMYAWGRGFVSPDNHNYSDPQDFVADKLGEAVEEKCQTMEDVLGAFREAGYAIKGIYRMEHSAVAYKLGDANPFSCGWDSGPVGFAFMSPEKMKEEQMTPEMAYSCLDAEMEEYSAYANGDVFVISFYDEHGVEADGVSTCFGLDSVEAEWPYLEPIDLDEFCDLAEYLADKAEQGEVAQDSLIDSAVEGFKQQDNSAVNLPERADLDR